MKRHWCDVCRGGSDGGADKLLLCASCPRKFHRECAGISPGAAVSTSARWSCAQCVAADGAADADGRTKKKSQQTSIVQKRTAAVRKAHRSFRANTLRFVSRQRENLLPFIPAARLDEMQPEGKAAAGAAPVGVPMIGKCEPYITAQLREYQVSPLQRQTHLQVPCCCWRCCLILVSRTQPSLLFLCMLAHK